jgi:hypothetical protein
MGRRGRRSEALALLLGTVVKLHRFAAGLVPDLQHELQPPVVAVARRGVLDRR